MTFVICELVSVKMIDLSNQMPSLKGFKKLELTYGFIGAVQMYSTSNCVTVFYKLWDLCLIYFLFDS